MDECPSGLHEAVQQGNTDEVLRFLKSGCGDINEPSDGLTPLQWASDCGFPNLCALLVEAGANPNYAGEHEDRFTPLHLAAWNGDVNVIERLLQLKANPAFVSSNDATAIHLACQDGHTDVIKLLAKAGCSINSADGDGDRPLHLAACGSNQKGHRDAVEALLELGANPLLKKRSGGLPKSSTKDKGICSLLETAEDKAHDDGLPTEEVEAAVRLTQDSVLKPSREENLNQNTGRIPKKRVSSPKRASPAPSHPTKRVKDLTKENRDDSSHAANVVPNPPVAFHVQQSRNLQKIQEAQLKASLEIEAAKRQAEEELRKEQERREQAIKKAQEEEDGKPPEVKRRETLSKTIFKLVTGESTGELKQLLQLANVEHPTASYTLSEAEAAVLELQEKNLLFYDAGESSVFAI